MHDTDTSIQAASSTWEAACDRRVLSVAVPFFNHDILRLTSELIDQIAPHHDRIELILGDDGSTDQPLIRKIAETVRAAPAPCALLSASRNLGRARIRNRLAEAARSEFILFLDADMLPDSDEFISRYQNLAASGGYDVVCGGHGYQRCPRVAPEERLYVYQSRMSDCIDAARRNRAGGRYLFTSNMLVRKDLFLSVRMDDRFHGWGWEDTEWAIRMLRRARVHHIDNTTTHLGLLRDDDLLRRLEGTVENYQLLLRCHPEEASRFPVTRVSRRLARVPGVSRLLGRVCRAAAASRRLPLRIRHVSLQLYKAALYAPVFQKSKG